jgi:vacuolar-type H+-ATPase subunit I/STV1
VTPRNNISFEHSRQPFLSRLVELQVVIAAITVLVSIIIGLRIPSLIKQKAQLEQELQQKSRELSQTNEKLEEAKRVLLAINPILEKYGVLKSLSVDSLNSNLVKQSFEANQQIQIILSNAFKERGVAVWYFTKDVDVDPVAVKDSLEQFGFKVIPKPPQRPDLSTNLIAFGEHVEPEDAKLVAYTLIRAGVEIRALCKTSAIAKTSIIQVLGEDRIRDRPTLSVEQIRNKSAFIQCPANDLNVSWPPEQ